MARRAREAAPSAVAFRLHPPFLSVNQSVNQRLYQLFLLNLCLQIFDGVATYEGVRLHWSEGNPLLLNIMPYLGLGTTLLLFKAKACGFLLVLRRLDTRPFVCESMIVLAAVYVFFSFIPGTTGAARGRHGEPEGRAAFLGAGARSGSERPDGAHPRAARAAVPGVHLARRRGGARSRARARSAAPWPARPLRARGASRPARRPAHASRRHLDGRDPAPAALPCPTPRPPGPRRSLRPVGIGRRGERAPARSPRAGRRLLPARTSVRLRRPSLPRVDRARARGAGRAARPPCPLGLRSRAGGALRGAGAPHPDDAPPRARRRPQQPAAAPRPPLACHPRPGRAPRLARARAARALGHGGQRAWPLPAGLRRGPRVHRPRCSCTSRAPGIVVEAWNRTISRSATRWPCSRPPTPRACRCS